MKKLYTVRDKEIVSLEIVAEVGTSYYLRDLDEFKCILPLEKDLIGDGIYHTFEQCQEARLTALKGYKKDITEQIKLIKEQEVAEPLELLGENTVVDDTVVDGSETDTE